MEYLSIYYILCSQTKNITWVTALVMSQVVAFAIAWPAE
jgi:hypothetical protein